MRVRFLARRPRTTIRQQPFDWLLVAAAQNGSRDYFRLAASLDRKRLGQTFGAESGSRSEAFSMRRLGGSRWRLRRTRGMRLAMEFEWSFFRFLFGDKR